MVWIGSDFKNHLVPNPSHGQGHLQPGRFHGHSYPHSPNNPFDFSLLQDLTMQSNKTKVFLENFSFQISFGVISFFQS